MSVCLLYIYIYMHEYVLFMLTVLYLLPLKLKEQHLTPARPLVSPTTGDK